MPGFTRAHMKLIGELGKEALVRQGYSEFSKEGWFLYFWKEARAQGGFIGKSAEILPFLNELYAVPPEWVANPLDATRYVAGTYLDYQPTVPANRRVQALTYASSWETVSDANLLRCLNACLGVGFERVRATTNDLGNLADLNSPLAFTRHNMVLDRDHSYTVGWRGDGRRLSDLRTAGGFLPKADSDQPSPDPHDQRSYAEKINLRQPWHPFSLPATRSHYYYRREQQDNCLHTVVSVTLDFITASTFPKLEDLVASAMSGQPLQPADTLDNPPPGLLPRLATVRSVGAKPVRRFADKQQLYLVVLFGGFFDTQRKQSGDQEIDEGHGSFPEVAVKRIPANNILGCLSFVRVFHGLTEADGFTAVFDEKGSTRPTIERCEGFAGNQKLARNLLRELTRQFNAIATSMPYRACWTGTGGQRLPNPMRLLSVVSANGSHVI